VPKGFKGNMIRLNHPAREGDTISSRVEQSL
jgi:hypothetical protein